MSKAGQENTTTTNKAPETPRSLAVSQKGVATGRDFANLMSALMSDLVEGKIPVDVANAMCNAGRGLLKVVEMQHRYGKQQPEDDKTLVLATPNAQ